MSRRAHRAAARAQRVCAVTGRAGAFHPHHVVRESDVHNLDPHDPRNALRLSVDVHFRHHSKMERVPLAALSDENIEFAFEELGPTAYDYLHRHYAGPDMRVMRLFHRLQTEANA